MKPYDTILCGVKYQRNKARLKIIVRIYFKALPLSCQNGKFLDIRFHRYYLFNKKHRCFLK